MSKDKHSTHCLGDSCACNWSATSAVFMITQNMQLFFISTRLAWPLIGLSAGIGHLHEDLSSPKMADHINVFSPCVNGSKGPHIVGPNYGVFLSRWKAGFKGQFHSGWQVWNNNWEVVAKRKSNRGTKIVSLFSGKKRATVIQCIFKGLFYSVIDK